MLCCLGALQDEIARAKAEENEIDIEPTRIRYNFIWEIDKKAVHH